ncbi:hypothetical protein EG68_00810 [Paragonimus skrjabini miyazakii]|uniref:non-specific serine/threonine protein kinase n=1 Tax=Paragonimus skrjabini miyazakii TaxID=59628 RepID=A0A8S9Z345_9TREM|nr:hypothetical protein EG68_00810 [Paragonimus skrjabini miyazakii]
MDRYTSDFESVLKLGKIKPTNVIKAAYNVLNALEYLHSKDYAHADIKAANLLYTNCFEEVTLVDFGLVHLFRVNGAHCSAKPDVKFKHNGTLEFCSRDAHSGLPPSRRGDLEILLYNIIHWLARCQPGAAQSHSTGLPWGHLIADPKLRAEVPDRVRVQVATLKEQAMQNVECMFSNVGLQPNPDFTRFMLAIKQLGYDETPNYQQLRHYLLAFHKQLTLDTVKTKNAVSVISSKRDVTGHTSEVNGGPSGTKISAVDIDKRNVKSTTNEVLMPTKRPRGRLQGTTNSGHRKESTTVTDSGVVDPVDKPLKVTNKKSVTARTNATGRQTPTSAVSPAINPHKPLSGLKRTPLAVHPTRASPRLIAANSPVPKTVPTCPRTSLSDLFWDSEDSEDFARHGSQIKSQKPILVREPSGRKVLTPLNPTPNRLIANSPSSDNRKNTVSRDVRRRSGFCQTSPELLLLARSEALQRRALDRAHNMYIG